MAIVDDLSIYYSLDDFAVPVTRQRPATADITFNGIVGVADQAEMDGHVMSTQREVQFAVADVIVGDTLVIDTTPYRVLSEPRLLNDGAEMLAFVSDIV